MFIKVKWSKGEIQDGKRLIEKRRKVLVSANDLFSELGYENTTMTMISQKTGISLFSLLFLVDGGQWFAMGSDVHYFGSQVSQDSIRVSFEEPIFMRTFGRQIGLSFFVRISCWNKRVRSAWG